MLFEERCEDNLRSPSISDLSFISPPSSGASSSVKKNRGRPRAYSDGYIKVQNSFTHQLKLRLDYLPQPTLHFSLLHNSLSLFLWHLNSCFVCTPLFPPHETDTQPHAHSQTAQLGWTAQFVGPVRVGESCCSVLFFSVWHFVIMSKFYCTILVLFCHFVMVSLNY